MATSTKTTQPQQLLSKILTALFLGVVLLAMFVRNTSATVNIYSGFPNPVWNVSDQEFQELEAMLQELSSNVSPDSDFDVRKLGLGYRGIYVSHKQIGIPVKSIHVYGNRISVTSFGSQKVYSDSGYAIQTWLLDSLEQHIDPSEYDALVQTIQGEEYE